MVHLRIVVPNHQSGHTLDLLENTPSVCNLIYLERVARKPEGDVILCDVAREDASVIISDLRELEIDREGSIAIEEIDSQISEVAIQAEKAAAGLPSDAVVWEEVEAHTQENVELSAPLAGLCVALVHKRGDLVRRSLTAPAACAPAVACPRAGRPATRAHSPAGARR